MTYLQERLLDEATDMWRRGFRISTHLYAVMAGEGLDVIALEELYYIDSPNEENSEEEMETN